MLTFKITSQKTGATLSVKAKGHRQSHPDSTTLIGVNQQDHAAICEFWNKNKDETHYNDGFYVTMPGNSACNLDVLGWELN